MNSVNTDPNAYVARSTVTPATYTSVTSCRRV